MPNWEKMCNSLNCVSLHPDEKFMDPQKVLEIKSSNRAVLCYTVNDEKRARELFSFGVDAIYSDCPEEILYLRK